MFGWLALLVPNDATDMPSLLDVRHEVGVLR
jgi:hypothetical protein